ncbi:MULTISPECIES: M23 family metallopeptidase [Nocardiopsis]|uniref:M23 family metallopeptidase n=1 Tax=Nocardiopsis TaxID=2013 RepID=UPI0033CF9307
MPSPAPRRSPYPSGRPVPRWPLLLARVRMPLMWTATLALLAGYLGLSWWVGGVLFAAALAVYLRLGAVRCEPRVLEPPVRGRWMALTSPVDSVPSQGSHAYGQTHALGLVAEPGAGARPDIGWRPLSRPPGDFPAFGQPVHAPADGTVVTAHGSQRDHRSRNSWPWLFGSVVENTLRELRGPAGLLGNHLVIDVGGAYVLLGHLERGSLAVRRGDRVRAGQTVARCGNSGACTEPQVRMQLMDRPGPVFAAGLPFVWAPGWNGGDGGAGLPETWRPVVVAGPGHGGAPVEDIEPEGVPAGQTVPDTDYADEVRRT